MRLFRCEKVGPISFFALLKVYRTAGAALNELPASFRRASLDHKIASLEDTKKEYVKLKKFGADIIAYCEPGYPPLLRYIKDPPPVITICGKSNLLDKDCIALVGSRNASIHGCKFARQLSKDLGEEGYVTVSGLAIGIDGEIHRESIKEERPTIAVLGGGINVIYPKSNSDIYQEIMEKNGLLISEFPFDSSPVAGNFPMRNRIISGISLGVVVIEAAKASGSLITANCAMDQGREVFAVPGSPLDKRSEGSNDLIKQGAILVESVEDILQTLQYSKHKPISDIFKEDSGPLFRDMSSISDRDIASAKITILNSIGIYPTKIEEIISETRLRTRVVLIALVELEMQEEIKMVNNDTIVAVLKKY